MNGISDLPLLQTDIHSPHEGVTQVKAVAEQRGFRSPRYKVNCLAYNPFHRSGDTWWVSPTGQNPAYQFPKIAFSPKTGPVTTEHLFIGLNIEKGLTGAASTAFQEYPERCRRWIMTPEWAWHRFMQELRTGVINECIEQAAVRAGQSVTVVLKASEVVCPEDRLARDRHDFRIHTGDWHELQFLFENGLLMLRHDQADPRTPGLFHGVQRAKRLLDVLRLIEDIGGADGRDGTWKWVDLYVGHHFCLASSSGGPEVWRAEELWQRICLAWQDWLWPDPHSAC